MAKVKTNVQKVPRKEWKHYVWSFPYVVMHDDDRGDRAAFYSEEDAKLFEEALKEREEAAR